MVAGLHSHLANFHHGMIRQLLLLKPGHPEFDDYLIHRIYHFNCCQYQRQFHLVGIQVVVQSLVPYCAFPIVCARYLTALGQMTGEPALFCVRLVYQPRVSLLMGCTSDKASCGLIGWVYLCQPWQG